MGVKREENGFFKRSKLRAAMLALPMLLLFGGAQAEAAPAKETPLVNLAEGITEIIDNNGRRLSNPERLTDGDKYGLKHNETGNKVNGAWETYTEEGAVAGGHWVWVQLDLGASYDIEVINLKRQVYDGATTNSAGNNARIQGTPITYQNTAVVISENEDMSDGYVVYYQGRFDIPNITEPAPSQPYVEPMGGQWFYMDYENNQGLGQTELGTTRKARYVRVYTLNPLANADSVNFLELGVYGYREESKIQSPSKRRTINNENPLMISTAYSDDVYAIGQTKEPTLQGYNTVSGRCRAIPEDLKKYTTMLLHTNNLRQFSPQHIGQANIQAFFEHGLQICYENNTSAMLVGISASATPGGAHWYPLRDMDYGWLDLMYRMYPNMEGTLNTENYWSGAPEAVAVNSARQLEMAHKYGGYFVWADQDHGGYIERAFANDTWKTALDQYGESCFMLYKNTGAGADDLESTSYHQGHWLAGYTGGWGMLSDTWFWDSKRQGKLYQNGASYNNWQRLCGVPEALMGAQMLSTYLEGGVIYTFEFPEIVYGSNNTNSPTFQHVIADLFRYFIANPAPDKTELLAETKVMVYGGLGNKDIYTGTAGAQTGINVYETGRYGNIPVILALDSYENARAKLAGELQKAGVENGPALLEVSDASLNGQARLEYFQGLYPPKYEGTAFADYRNGTWYVYNSVLNTNTMQTAELPLSDSGVEGTKIKAEIEPHTYFMLTEENGGKEIHLRLNNYRINKDETIFNNKYGLTWTGSFAPGQSVIEGKKSVYDFMTTYNVVNAGQGQHSPEDNTLRSTTFVISNLAGEPTVALVKGQQPDTDGLAQYQEPAVEFNSSTGEATITITCNGWVECQISNLQFAGNTDTDSEESTEEIRENMAQGKSLSFSSETSDLQRATHAVDGIIDPSNYSDPGGNAGGAHWLQVDLGESRQIDEVILYRYWGDERQYDDTVVLVSADADFSPDKTLVLWNNNRDGDRIWPGSGNGQTDGHTLPAGNDGLYTEEENGKSLPVSAAQVNWLDGNTERTKPGEGESVEARYIRVYMNGNNIRTTNHVVELQVLGK